ncbi:MAG TPA: transglutaminase-like domain-containing protein [Nitrososphaeraceae archaeon]|jgi:regulator of sirC expression with transglutaminase-like and TPR domain|nr:transglutaminase-like domain-containing protein [Nitrososphaeraceae archaeon]
MLSINNLQSLLEDWKANVVNPAVSSNNIDRLAEYALHLSRIVAYPDLDISLTVKKIDTMGEELKQSIKKLMPLRPTQIIEKINNFLFKEKEFKANVQDYYNPVNSYLNVVLQHKCGIPITLSILYMRIGYLLNFKLYPVNFPAHFLVKHILENDNSEIIIDPFNGGRIMDDYAMKALLDQFYPHQNIPLTRAFVEKATATQVMIRMLNNLKASYYEAQDLDKTEIANEMILSIDRRNPDAMRDKGMILLKRGKSNEALEMLNLYLELDPEAEDADAVLEIIRQIRTPK